MNKKDLYNNFRNNIYCKIGVSKIEGVGVIAIRSIPKGTNPFVGSFKGKYLSYTTREIASMDKSVQELITAFFVKEGEKVWVPVSGLNGIDISFFMNHSLKPNVISDKNGENFVTCSNIKVGEELTINYTDCYGKQEC